MAYGKKGYKKQYKTEKVLAYKPKRGKLAPLMAEEQKQGASIHELSYDFGCRITRLFQYLTEDAEYKEFVISKQIYRSGTSVGANVRESKPYPMDFGFGGFLGYGKGMPVCLVVNEELKKGRCMKSDG